MEQTYIVSQIFDHIDYKANPLSKGEYENCNFKSCDFSNSDLSEIVFDACEFSACNLSLVKISKTAFREVKFRDCKMLGLRFDTCNEFGLSFSFDNCSLNHSTFYQAKLRMTIFKNCQLHEIEFTESDMTGSTYDKCDLMGAKFENTIIEKADFRTSYNYSIDPESNRIKKAKFSLTGVPGLLFKYDIEIDETR
jgi:fluoroquinolone resistance protein